MPIRLNSNLGNFWHNSKAPEWTPSTKAIEITLTEYIPLVEELKNEKARRRNAELSLDRLRSAILNRESQTQAILDMVNIGQFS